MLIYLEFFFFFFFSSRRRHTRCSRDWSSDVCSSDLNITLYPVARGPDHPARFTGSVDRNVMTLTVTLTDTAVTLGPVRLELGKEPQMGPCPICLKPGRGVPQGSRARSEEHTSELQSRLHLVCRLLLEKKKIIRL